MGPEPKEAKHRNACSWNCSASKRKWFRGDGVTNNAKS